MKSVRRSDTRMLACAASCIGAALSPHASGQAIQPPLVNIVDENNVRIASLPDVVLPGIDLSIGDPTSGMSRAAIDVRRYPSTEVVSYTQSDNYNATIEVASGPGGTSGGVVLASVSLNGKVHQFAVGTWTDHVAAQSFYPGPYSERDGAAKMTCTAIQLRNGSGTCTMVTEDGTTVVYDLALRFPTDYHRMMVAKATSITKADGEVSTLIYASASYGQYLYSVSSSLGWMMKYENGTNGQSKISLFNTSVQHCAPSAISCAAAYAYPTGDFVPTGNTVSLIRNGQPVGSFSDTGGGNGRTVNISSPSGVNVGYYFGNLQYGNYQTTSPLQVTKGGSVWNYSFKFFTFFSESQYAKGDHQRVGPDGGTRRWKVDFHDKIYSYTNEVSQTTAYEYPKDFRSSSEILRITRPDGSSTGGYTQYGYEAPGRFTDETVYPLDNSGLSPLTRHLTYGCTVQACRDKPTRIVDARGYATDIQYDPTHGGVVSETMPADASGVRPQKRYSYTLLYPRIRDASGALVNSTPVYRLTQISTCRSATPANPASCVGTAAEIVTTYAYGTNNLQRTSETIAAGDGSVSATTTFTYNEIGKVTSVNGPRTDVDDTSYRTYDAQGRLIYEIGPDPDGPGALKRQIVKHFYDVDWREYQTQTGSGTATDGSDFVATRFKRTIYSTSTGLVVRVEEGAL